MGDRLGTQAPDGMSSVVDDLGSSSGGSRGCFCKIATERYTTKMLTAPNCRLTKYPRVRVQVNSTS